MIRRFLFFIYIIDNIFKTHGEYFNGNFRVKYPDGKISTRMWYFTARDYKYLFGGEIILHFEIN